MTESTRERLAAKFCGRPFPMELTCVQPRDHEGECGTGGPFVWPRLTDKRSTHSFAAHLDEDKCRCGKPAAHKVEDTSGPGNFHPMTNYLCCEHFTQWVGECGGNYPWDYDQP